MDFDLYVPVAGYALAVDPKSAITGSPARQWLENREALVDGRTAREVTPDTNLVIDYEGNRYGARSMQTFADRALVAVGRHKEHYPTIARAIVPAKRLIRVGTFDYETEEVRVLEDGGAALKLMAWLDVDPDQLQDELRGTSIRALRAEG